MSVALSLLVAVALGGPSLAAGDGESAKKVAKAKVEELNAAMMKGDFGKVADLTHPQIVALAGGREKLVAVMEQGAGRMKEDGVQFQSVQVDEPSDPVAAGSELFVVVPFLLEIKVPGGKLLQKSFVIGVSSDRGKSWSFVNGYLDIKTVRKVLPTLPDELKLPALQKPVLKKE